LAEGILEVQPLVGRRSVFKLRCTCFTEIAIEKSCADSELIHMPQTKHWRGFQAN